MSKKLALLLAAVVACPIFAGAEDLTLRREEESTRARMGEVKDQVRFHKMIDSSAEVYRAMTSGSPGTIPASTLKNARCIAVMPEVMTGALVVGGTYGSGLASCRDANDRWSQPAPISLSQGSIGLQAGAKSADLVLFFQSKEAVAALKKGNFSFGSDISAVAGTYDSNVDTSKAGILVFSRNEGLFAGAAVNGGKIGNDRSELASYYGKKTDYTALLEGRESPDVSGYTERLTKLF